MEDEDAGLQNSCAFLNGNCNNIAPAFSTMLTKVAYGRYWAKLSFLEKGIFFGTRFCFSPRTSYGSI